MEPATSILVGTGLVTLTAVLIVYFSVVGQALQNYAISTLFEKIGEDDTRTRARFEQLTRRDDEFLQVASLGTIICFVAHYLGWMLIIAMDASLYQFWHLLFAGGLSIVLLVLCVAIAPPLVLRRRDEEALIALLPFFSILSLPFKPFTVIGVSATRLGARIEGIAPEDSAKESFAEDLADSLDEAEREGVLDEEEREMIHNIVALGQTPASHAMIPRTDMICCELKDGLDEALRLAVEHGHSRVPVFEGDRDHIIGIFYTRDLVPTWSKSEDRSELELRSIIRPARFWPETKQLDDLLREMREDSLKIAILLDEHGGTAGLITLEDILEEIVGDIRDEFEKGDADRSYRPVLPFTEGRAEADADVDLDELNRLLELDLPESSDYNSLGGLILHEIGRLPEHDETLTIDSLRLKVLDVDEKRIRRVEITQLTPLDETGVKG